MAKRNNRDKSNAKLKNMIIRNWIICGISLVAIIILFVFTK